jgi:signal transduction histidine kinase
MSATRAHVVAAGERALFDHHPVPTWELDCAAAFTWLEHHAPAPQPGDELSDAAVLGFAERLKVLDVNQQALRFLGFKDREAAKARYEDGSVLTHRMLGARKAVTQLWRGEPNGCAETTTTLGDGEIRSISVCLALCQGLDGPRSRMVLSVHDTTAQRQIETELRRDLHHQELAIAAAELGTFDIDAETGQGNWSPKFAELWNVPDGFEGDISELTWKQVHPDDLERVRAEFARLNSTPGLVSNFEFRVQRLDGTFRWIAWRAQRVDGRLLGINVDVTDRKKLEDAFRQSQKMEAFGQLAAGVAHDFNNLLTVMIGNLDLLASGEPVEPEVTQELQQAVTRASNLTRQLLAFSRQAPQAKARIDLNDVASNMARLLRRLIGGNIAFTAHLEPAPLHVSANAGMLEQVLVNLTLNARDAMPQGGELRIETRRVHLSSLDVKGRAEGRAGHFAVLSVSDTGIGMDAGLVDRIFEPFFTTKDAGKGTGLGLATALSIVQQHRGWIDVQSVPGRGSSFQVYLPLEEENLVEAPVRARRVLIAEDEAPVRRLLRRLLEKAGFDVVEASSGTQALEVWAREKDQIALLITDMVMPGGISGRQLATRMTLEKPELKVMYASGYVPEGSDALTLPGAVFITKPFSRDELVRKVSELLA